MRICDSEGRIFGRINIIDLLAVLLLLASMPMFYIGYKIFNKKPSVVVEGKDYVDIELDCEIIKLLPQDVAALKAGLREYDKSGIKIGEIISLSGPQPYEYAFTFGDGEIKTMKDQKLLKISAILRLRAEVVKGGNLNYKDATLYYNTPFDFNPGGLPLKVVIIRNDVKKWVKVKVKFAGAISELSELVSKGNLEKDKNGRVIGELTEILSNTATNVPVLEVDENRQILVNVLNGPLRNDIVAIFNLLCVEKDGTLYFQNYPIKIGSEIVFSSDIYSAKGVIIGIEGIGNLRESDAKPPL